MNSKNRSIIRRVGGILAGLAKRIRLPGLRIPGQGSHNEKRGTEGAQPIPVPVNRRKPFPG